jgi:hypothetical protein
MKHSLSGATAPSFINATAGSVVSLGPTQDLRSRVGKMAS